MEQWNFRSHWNSTMENMLQMSKEVENRIQYLEDKEKKWKEIENKIEENASQAKQKIKLDVGGKIFATTKSALMRVKDSYFSAMIGSGKWQPDEDGIVYNWRY